MDKKSVLKMWVGLTTVTLVASLFLPLPETEITWTFAILLALWSVVGLGVVVALWPYQAHTYELQRFAQRLAVQFTWLGAGRWLGGIVFLVSAFALFSLSENRPLTPAQIRQNLVVFSGIYALFFLFYHGGTWLNRLRNKEDEEKVPDASE